MAFAVASRARVVSVQAKKGAKPAVSPHPALLTASWQPCAALQLPSSLQRGAWIRAVGKPALQVPAAFAAARSPALRLHRHHSSLWQRAVWHRA
jgi:hypothetical protein